MQRDGGIGLLDGREGNPLFELFHHRLVYPQGLPQRNVLVGGAGQQVADVVVGEGGVGLEPALPFDGPVEEGDGLGLHLVYRAVVEGNTQSPQSGEAFEYVHRDPRAGRHALEPTPTAVAALEVLQFENGLAREPVGPVGIEEGGQLLQALGLVVGFEYPRGGREQNLFQLLVLSQERGEVLAPGGLPRLDSPDDERVAAGHRRGQTVGIEHGRYGDGIVVGQVGEGG